MWGGLFGPSPAGQGS